MKRIIGWAILWPWLGYRFASKRMTPRFDQHGRIYMLLCDSDTVTPTVTDSEK